MLPAHGQLCHPGWGCQLHHRLTATPQLTEMSGCTAVFLGGHFMEEDSRSILLKNFLEELQKVRRGGSMAGDQKDVCLPVSFPLFPPADGAVWVASSLGCGASLWEGHEALVQCMGVTAVRSAMFCAPPVRGLPVHMHTLVAECTLTPRSCYRDALCYPLS